MKKSDSQKGKSFLNPAFQPSIPYSRPLTGTHAYFLAQQRGSRHYAGSFLISLSPNPPIFGLTDLLQLEK